MLFTGGLGNMSLKLEAQVPSLELCKKLKSFSYPQEGLFWWTNTWDKDEWQVDMYPIIEVMKDGKKRKPVKFIAPTVAEMGEWLPNYVKDDTNYLQIVKSNDGKFWFIQYDNGFGNMETEGKTEANARAKCLIWLVENDYIDFKEIKE